MVEMLLKQGANINNQDKRGQTPINFAVRHNKHNLKDLLVQFGATPPLPSKSKGAASKMKQALPVVPK